ncbi:chromosome alignment-maintaining phosphoprotein 1-like isoform X2 [Xyrichtys novacula]|uniref:Chromosome alignment-maintaining phosphoprotein 1-like isoform X2 n=1 Tax=Xyrichtys novacula TaxID=13765 RepID=A0AAV1HS37_XYRNO|nr:chromosome alignment-maintaining phosphoprotein 1-like isoform X2 [Xyrichtys novacula]
MAEQGTFVSWKYSHYFEFFGEKNQNNILVKCKLCLEDKILSTAKNSTSNLKKHLQARHSSVTLEARSTEGEEDAPAPKQLRLASNSTNTIIKRETNRITAGCVVGEDEEEEEEEEEEEKLPISRVEAKMSVIIQTRGEAGGGVAAHLQCPFCGHFSKSHAHQLSHMAASHPASLDNVSVGRLGNILMYQSTARLFHCSDCFFTTRDFTKLYQHLITTHCMDEREGGGGDEGDEGGGEDGGEKVEVKVEEEMEVEEKEKEAVEAKKNSEAEEEEENGEEHPEDPAPQKVEPEKTENGGDESVLVFDGAGYRCLICNWRSAKKGPGINHVVRKHDIPRAYANQSVRQHVDFALKLTQGGGAEEEEGVPGLSGEMLKEELEATSKVVRFISNRFQCLICGWKTKLKGFAISHVERSHDVERPYHCKDCKRSFFLPSRLQQHISSAHRPGRYACPFCCFRNLTLISDSQDHSSDES